MHVAVIGAGLAGLSSAYFLHRAGASVTVVDRQPHAARETSYANGSLLTPSLADPWNGPGVFKQLLTSIGRDDAAMLLHPAQLPHLWRWGISFLLNARRARYEQSFLHNVRLAAYSLEMLAEIDRDTGLEFERAGEGILKTFETPESLANAARTARWLAAAGIEHRELDVDATLALEPALADVGARLAGAIHYPGDAVGNARLYCEGLAEWLARAGVSFRFGVEVSGLVADARRIRSLRLADEELTADAFLLAAGSFSPRLARGLGLRIPVVPVKGYSVTVALQESAPYVAPNLPVIDEALHAAVVPLGQDRLRCAGTAEFAGYDSTVRPARIRNLLALLRRIYPAIDPEQHELESWAGLRPMTPDGRPIIGPCPFENLFLNTGHGALGWTHAAASGKVSADWMLGRASSQEWSAFSLARF